MAKRTPEEIAIVKRLITDRISGGPDSPTIVLRELGVRRDEVWKWCKADPEFDQAYKEAKKALSHYHADRLLTLHEEDGIDDAKLLAVVSKNVQWYVEKTNPEDYGQKAAPVDSQPQLLGILQAAVNRLIEQVPAPLPPPLPAIELKPSP